jgi:hypothetical protein
MRAVDAFEKFADGNPQGMRDAYEINDRDVPLAAFHRPCVIPVNSGKLCEPLLGKSSRQPVFPYGCT